MHNPFEWTAAAIGLILFVGGLVVVLTERVPGGVGRVFRSARDAGLFAILFGVGLVLLGSAFAFSSHRWLQTVVTIVGVLLVAASMRYRPFQKST